MRTTTFLSALLSLAQISFAQTPNNNPRLDSIDSLLQTEFKPSEPGIAVLIARKDHIIFQKAYGSANMELNIPLTANMVFRIGSISKQFTAVGILKLVEQGKLSLQDSIQQYLPEFPSKGYPITIENLLTHTSGLKDYTSIESPIPYIERHDFTSKFIIDYFKNEPLNFKPGTKYAYTNSGYVLLGAIMEKITKSRFETYMKDSVLQPAGLLHTYYASEHDLVPARVSGYTKDRGFYENAEYQSISLGFACGDLLSTAQDLYLWNTALLSEKIISKTMLNKAFTPYILNSGEKTEYGYGWFVTTINGSRCIKHEGQTSGFISLEYYFPEEETYVTILTNLKSGEDKTNFSDHRFLVFQQIIGMAIDKKNISLIDIGTKRLESYAGEYRAATGTKTIQIKVKGKKLYLHDDIDFEMKALSETRFLLLNIPVKTNIEFIMDDKGKVIKLIADQKQKTEWTKINSNYKH